MNGFLGAGATLRADINLVVQALMGLALLAGMFLARRRRFRAHKYCQASVMMLNLIMIALIMAPSFHHQVQPHFPAGLRETYYLIPYIHAILGGLAELLGLYIVLVAATNILPQRLRFRRFKPWMRTELALWWIVILIGLATYYVWYVKPLHQAAAPQTTQAAKPSAPGRVTVTIKNFQFDPQDLTVPAGTTVEWLDNIGRHSIVAEQGGFKSPVLASGGQFEHKFDAPGAYPYYCGEHGKGVMAGTITVTNAP